MNAPLSKMQAARMRMLVKHPFFATLMMSMPMIERRDIPTAATDMKHLYYNPDFIESLDTDEVMTVIGHEVMHTALEHGLRKQTRDHVLWNIACDYAINPILVNSSFTNLDKIGWLYDAKYFNMSADQIYALLQKEKSKQPKDGQGQGRPGMGEPGGAHHTPMLGDLMEPEGSGDPVKEDAIRRDIQQRVTQAATVARMQGNLSGDLERFVKDILEPRVPWQELLRHYMTSYKENDETWMKRNSRFANVFLPACYSESMGPIIEILDTSGSIGNEELAQYASEGSAIAEELNPETIRLVWADTRVAGEQLFEQGETVTPEPKGGGGTDMRVPLKHVEQYEPEVVILFTDGYTPWPDHEPDYPLIVVCTTNVEVPIGQVVRI